MKKSFFHTSVIAVVFTLSLASCGKGTTNPPEDSIGGTGTVAQMPWLPGNPMVLEQNAPKVEESLAKVGSKLKEEPAYRACIARSAQTCGSEVISRFSQEKDSDAACEVFEDASLKTSCINAINTELARKKSDISFCAKLDPSSKAMCEQQAIISQAIKTKDVSLCAKLQTRTPEEDRPASSGAIMPPMMIDPDSQCTMQVLMSLEASQKNLEACKTITNEATKQNCVSMLQSRIDMQRNMPISPLPTAPAKPWRTSSGLQR